MEGKQDSFFRYDYPKVDVCCPCGKGLRRGVPTLRILQSMFKGNGAYAYRCIDCGNRYVKDTASALARINKAIGEAIDGGVSR